MSSHLVSKEQGYFRVPGPNSIVCGGGAGWTSSHTTQHFLETIIGCRAPMLSGWAILSDLPCIHQLEALCTLSFWVFVETSFHGHEPLNHWSVAINSTSSSSLYLEAGGRTETGAANALTTWLCSVASVMSDSL